MPAGREDIGELGRLAAERFVALSRPLAARRVRGYSSVVGRGVQERRPPGTYAGSQRGVGRPTVFWGALSGYSGRAKGCVRVTNGGEMRWRMHRHTTKTGARLWRPKDEVEWATAEGCGLEICGIGSGTEERAARSTYVVLRHRVSCAHIKLSFVAF